MWTTEWTGAFPNLCCGEWHLYKDGKEIPNPFTYEGEYGTESTPAYTKKDYFYWFFNKDYLEEFDCYEDGYSCKEWCEENKAWLESIAPKKEWEEIYEAFKENDWRYGSCGGCI